MADTEVNMEVVLRIVDDKVEISIDYNGYYLKFMIDKITRELLEIIEIDPHLRLKVEHYNKANGLMHGAIRITVKCKCTCIISSGREIGFNSYETLYLRGYESFVERYWIKFTYKNGREMVKSARKLIE